MEKIAAVVVTYNRFKYVKKTIECLRNQTKNLDAIIVIDNASDDGTCEWLDNQRDLIVIHQENLGGSGGFFRGIKEAHERKFDWIWCMDDDVYPREDCLERLLENSTASIGILCPKRIMGGKVFHAEYKKLNLTNPFKELHQAPLTDQEVNGNKVINIEAMAFEGPLVKKEVVDRIGYPNKDLFIIYDDTDYAYRCVLSGLSVVYVPSAILDKENFVSNKSKYEIVKSGRWKLWYSTRNGSYFRHHYGKNVLFRYFNKIPTYLEYTLSMLFNLIKNNKKYEWNDILKLWRMYYAGITEKLGKL